MRWSKLCLFFKLHFRVMKGKLNANVKRPVGEFQVVERRVQRGQLDNDEVVCLRAEGRKRSVLWSNAKRRQAKRRLHGNCRVDG